MGFLTKCLPLALIGGLLCLLQLLQGCGQSLLGPIQLLLHQLNPAVQGCHVPLSLNTTEKGQGTSPVFRVRIAEELWFQDFSQPWGQRGLQLAANYSRYDLPANMQQSDSKTSNITKLHTPQQLHL